MRRIVNSIGNIYMPRLLLRKLPFPLNASLLLCALSHTALACSGPTSEAFREQNRAIVNRYGLIAMFIFTGIVAVYFLRGRVGLFYVLIAALIGFFHPVWHFGMGSPDCGSHFAADAPYVTAILGGLFLPQIVLWLFRRRGHAFPTRT